MIKYVSNECQIECKISKRMAEALPWLNVWLWGAPFLCVSLMFWTYLGSVGSDVSGLHVNSFRHMSVLWLGAVLCLCNGWDLFRTWLRWRSEILIKESVLRGGFMLEGLRGRACCRTVCSASFPPHMRRATVKGREMLGKHVGQTAWQKTLADIFANHLCRRCWPLPLPGGFALMWPGMLSIPRLHQIIYIS